MQALLNQSLRLSTVKTTAVWLTLAILCPIVVHLIPPHNGIPIGAFLLPMFYIPLIVLWTSTWRIALTVSVLAPLLNFLLTGSPQPGIMYILTLEVILFAIIALFLISSPLKWAAGPLSYLGAKIFSSALLVIYPILPIAPFDFFVNSLQNGALGILILLIINLLLVRFFPRNT
ncbi:hypothetical protein ADIS_2454 [Lunatimonas lonarensis]|uniref:Transmembrane protein n=1 Tax=Lunatimonas lonarensis TaxID=1232681 RepID=R7ZSL0_9BACT|nr:hypothetical protein [Lunatimonas lonarensis]EON77072.1 hypothetical protein ADIS_2454 [Lunatimonas lonarensis]